MHVAFLNLLLLWQHSDNLLPLVTVLLLAEWSTADYDLQQAPVINPASLFESQGGCELTLTHSVLFEDILAGSTLQLNVGRSVKANFNCL